MLIRFACACGRRFRAMAGAVGRRFRCPACGAAARVPESPGANPVSVACPHCAAPTDPPPTRSRKCPHCRSAIVVRRGRLLSPAAAAEFDAEAARVAAGNKARRRAEMLRLGRETNAVKIRSAESGRVAIGFTLKYGPEKCRVCKGLGGKFIPIAGCTPEALPPYDGCELESGCLTYADEVLSPEFQRIMARASKGGPR